MNTLAVFRSRNDALRIYRILQRKGYAAITVNTPARLKMGCGLSVVFNEDFLIEVREIISDANIGTFAGFYPR